MLYRTAVCDAVQCRHIDKGGEEKTGNMPFLCHALNCSPEEFFVPSFCVARGYHTTSFDFMKYHFSTDICTFNILETLNLIWSDATASLGFPCNTSEHVPNRI